MTDDWNQSKLFVMETLSELKQLAKEQSKEMVNIRVETGKITVRIACLFSIATFAGTILFSHLWPAH